MLMKTKSRTFKYVYDVETNQVVRETRSGPEKFWARVALNSKIIPCPSEACIIMTDSDDALEDTAQSPLKE